MCISGFCAPPHHQQRAVHLRDLTDGAIRTSYCPTDDTLHGIAVQVAFSCEVLTIPDNDSPYLPCICRFMQLDTNVRPVQEDTEKMRCSPMAIRVIFLGTGSTA